MDILNRGGVWLADSGIRQQCGGVARFYRADRGEYVPISTEITGYAVSALSHLYSLTRNERYLAAARDAARFLTRTAWDARLELFPFEYGAGPANPEALAYFFDSGIVVRGLLSVWRLTREREFLDVAVACGRSMAKQFRDPSGEYHPILRLPHLEPLPRNARWSHRPGCYQLKSAMAWCELAEAGCDGSLPALYEEMLARYLPVHKHFLPGENGEDSVMDRLHAYCYFLEGLMPRLGQPACAAALRAGIGLAAGHLRRIAPRFARSDVYAQLLRLRLFAGTAGVQPLDGVAAEKEARELAEFQLEHEDPRIDGGFAFGRRTGRIVPHINPVSTIFALQALEMWRRHRNDATTLSPAELI